VTPHPLDPQTRPSNPLGGAERVASAASAFSVASLEAVARPWGEAPLPGIHLGRIGHAFHQLRHRFAGIFCMMATFAFSLSAVCIVGYLLFHWTWAHPHRPGGGWWRWLTRMLLVFAAPLSFFSTGYLSLFFVESSLSVPILVGLSCAMLVVGATIPMLAIEGIWRSGRRMLRAGRAAAKLRRSMQVSRVRLVLGGLAALVALGLMGTGTLTHTSATAYFGSWAVVEGALGLWMVVTLFQASRALALRMLPNPRFPKPIPGDDLLAQQQGLRLKEVAGLFAAQGKVDGRAVCVVVDPSTDPALLGVSVEVPGLEAHAPGLVLRGRNPDDPPGISLADLILERLVMAQCDVPEVVQPLVQDRHGPLLAIFQGWPGSQVVHGRVELKGTVDLGHGEERLGSQRSIDEAFADAMVLARALQDAMAVAS